MAETPAVCEHLHLPLQSGSDRVLAAMHRGYTAERYLEQAGRRPGGHRRPGRHHRHHRRASPARPTTTSSAPSRSWPRPSYDSAYTFIYSPRPGTEAAELVDQFVDPAVVAERFERLRVVVERSALAKHEARIGRVEEVVVEGPSSGTRRCSPGRTRQNKLVHFASAPVLRPGTYAEVLVTGAGAHFLRGELVEVTAAARAPHPHPRRRRLTVDAVPARG